MLPSHPFLGRFWNKSPQPPQYLSLCPYGWEVLATHTKNRPGPVHLEAFFGPSCSSLVSLFGGSFGVEIGTEIGFVTDFEIGFGAEIAIASEPGIEFGIVIVIVIVIGTKIGLVHLSGLSFSGSSCYVESWWGHGGGYPPGLSPHLMAQGEGHCPPSVSIL